MFEKEAEDYADKYVTEGVDELKRKVIKGHWQDGATFGYNKGKSEAVDIIKGLMRFCRCFAQHHTGDIRYKEAEQFLQEVEDGN